MDAPGTMPPAKRYRFADLTLDLGRRRLWRATETIELSKLTFNLLRVLVEQAPNVVAHEDLASRTWGSRRVVTPECLAKRVMLLRQALGDRADHPRYVERVRGQGYRLIPEVRELALDKAVAPDVAAAEVGPAQQGQSAPPGGRPPAGLRSSRRWAAPAGAALVLAAAAWTMGGATIGEPQSGSGGRTVAVLPFENRSAAEEDAGFFAEGIHDDLITRLAAIEDLKVTPRATVMEHRHGASSRHRIGEALDVDIVLAGSVQRAGDMVRVNVQLVDTRSDETLWGESYDEELTAWNVFAIQREIATTIARELRAKLTPTEATRLGETPTRNMRALDLYLSGRDYERPPFAYWGMAALQYERAVAEDPEFALAHARLSLASLLAFYSIDWNPARLETAKRSAEEAVRLQPDLALARVAMAFYLLSSGIDLERAAAELETAEPMARNEPQFFTVRAVLNERLGKPDEAMADRATALALSPRDPVLMLDVAQWHARVREHEEASRLVERALDIRPDFMGAEMFRAELALLRDGDAAPIRALSMDDFSEDLGRRARLWQLQWLGALYERDYEAAARMLDDLDGLEGTDRTASGESGEALEPSLPYLAGMACTLRAAGSIEAARELYRSGLERLDASDPVWHPWRAVFLAGAGKTKEAVELAGRVLADSPPDSPFTNDLRLWMLRDVLAPSRANAEAIEVLEQYLARPGNWSLEGVLRDPRLDSIRGDPRLHELVARHGRRSTLQFADRTEP